MEESLLAASGGQGASDDDVEGGATDAPRLPAVATAAAPSYKWVLPVLFGSFAGAAALFPSVANLRICYYGSKTTYLVSNSRKALGGFIGFAVATTIGALSDRLGRKWFLFASVISNLLPPALLVVPGVLEDYFWLYDVLGTVGNVTGGITFLSFAYAADTLSHDAKGKAFGVLGSMIPLAFLVGTGISVPLQKLVGDTGPAYVAAVLLPCLLFYVAFVLPESVGKRVGANSVDNSATTTLSSSLKEFTFRDKILFLWRTDRTVIRVSAIAVGLNTFGFAPVQEDLLTYMALRYCTAQTTAVITLVITGVLGIFSSALVAPWAKARYGIKKASICGFAMSALLLALLGLAWDAWVVFIVLILVVGAFMSFPLISALVSQAAGHAEQGIVNGAFTSLNAFAQGLSPIFFGGIFTGVQHWYENGNGAAEHRCADDTVTCGGDGSVSKWVLGLPWFAASLIILTSTWILRWLPEEEAPNMDGVDFAPDTAIELEPAVRQRANTTIGLSSSATAALGAASEGRRRGRRAVSVL